MTIKVIHIPTANILQMATYWATVTIANKYKVAYSLSIGIFTFDLGPILNIKVVHILTVNILQTLTDRANVAIAIK